MTDKHMILFAAAAILLTGCKSNEERLLEQLSDNETYQTYISLKEDGRLDENGYYNIYGDEAIPAMAAVQKQTGITFAENNRFSENVYYLDPEMTIPADDDCRLDKGECIYARIPEVSAEFSDSYKFNGYRICEWKDGVKNELTTVNSDNNLVYQIPDDFSGTEIIIEPVSASRERTLTFKAFFTDTDENETDVSGNWSVNGMTCNEPKITLPRTEAKNVSFDYDENEYYVLTSSPDSVNTDIQNGIIEFADADEGSGNIDYQVELKRFVQASFSGDTTNGIITVNVNAEDKGINDISKLRINDVIIVDIAPEYTLYCTQLENKTPEQLSDSKRYSFTVGDINSGTLNFHIEKTDKSTALQYSQPNIANGRIEVRINDTTNPYTLRDGNLVSKSTEVRVTITPDEGYYVSGKNVTDGEYSAVMKFSEYNKKSAEIISDHEIKKLINVTLDDTNAYGKVTYKLNGNAVQSGSYTLKQEDKLILEYEITDSSCEIYNPSANWLEGLLASKTKANPEIAVTPELDNKTIKAEDYISVRKKED